MWGHTDSKSAISRALASLKVTKAVFDCPASLHIAHSTNSINIYAWFGFSAHARDMIKFRKQNISWLSKMEPFKYQKFKPGQLTFYRFKLTLPFCSFTFFFLSLENCRQNKKKFLLAGLVFLGRQTEWKLKFMYIKQKEIITIIKKKSTVGSECLRSLQKRRRTRESLSR